MAAVANDPHVLLFYFFFDERIAAEAHRVEVEWHRALCARLSIFGRLRVAPVGLNWHKA